MLVFRSIPERATTSTILTIGNFDGVHRGHQALLERLTAHARRLALPAAVLTFEPHPREFFAPEQAPARLTSLREKLNLLESSGVDHVYVCRFDARLAALSAETFIERILVRGLATRHLMIGDDFRFGKGRGGDFALLQSAGAAHRFSVEAMPTLDWQGERVSSSAPCASRKPSWFSESCRARTSSPRSPRTARCAWSASSSPQTSTGTSPAGVLTS